MKFIKIKLFLSMLFAISSIYSSELNVQKKPDGIKIDMQSGPQLQAHSIINGPQKDPEKNKAERSYIPVMNKTIANLPPTCLVQ